MIMLAVSNLQQVFRDFSRGSRVSGVQVALVFGESGVDDSCTGPANCQCPRPRFLVSYTIANPNPKPKIEKHLQTDVGIIAAPQ